MLYEQTREEFDECLADVEKITKEELALLFASIAGAFKYVALNIPEEMQNLVEDSSDKIKNLLTKKELEIIKDATERLS